MIGGKDGTVGGVDGISNLLLRNDVCVVGDVLLHTQGFTNIRSRGKIVDALRRRLKEAFLRAVPYKRIDTNDHDEVVDEAVVNGLVFNVGLENPSIKHLTLLEGHLLRLADLEWEGALVLQPAEAVTEFDIRVWATVVHQQVDSIAGTVGNRVLVYFKRVASTPTTT